MKKTKLVQICFLLASLLALPTSLFAQQANDVQLAQRLTGSILVGGHSMQTLQSLTDTFGPRLTGSATYTGATEWAATQFRSYGIQNARLEPFSMLNGWQRGPASARIVSPVAQDLHAASFGWFPPTPASGLRGEVVLVKDISPEAITAQASQLKGKIVLLDRASVYAERTYKNEALIEKSPERLKSAGAIAVLIGGALPNNVLSTGDPLWRGQIGPLPGGILGREDAAAIKRWLEKGAVTVEINFQNQVSGPIQANNVVAEIRGSEKPDEWVIVGAHLDSWDFATGAQDNGAGAAQVLEAARAIAALGVPPKRSIRFALWGGEEEGLVGSLAYVQQHAGELNRCIANLNTDNGAGHPEGWKTQGRKDLQTALEPLGKSVLGSLGAGEISLDKVEFDTDHGSFLLQGVPALNLKVEDSKYDEAHHKQADTLDKVDAHSLADGAAVLAVTALSLANADKPIGPRLDHAAVGELLKKDSVDEYLKAQGLWPQ